MHHDVSKIEYPDPNWPDPEARNYEQLRMCSREFIDAQMMAEYNEAKEAEGGEDAGVSSDSVKSGGTTARGRGLVTVVTNRRESPCPGMKKIHLLPRSPP